MREKRFECRGSCKKQYVDMVLIGCVRCYKTLGINLTEGQAIAVAKILNRNIVNKPKSNPSH